MQEVTCLWMYVNVVFCRKKRMDVVDKTGTQTDKTNRREFP